VWTKAAGAIPSFSFVLHITERGLPPVATTYIKPYKTAQGKTASQTMFDRFEYGLAPQKCAEVCSHLCDPKTAYAEFMLVKNQYEAVTGRTADKGHLFFQIRQAFPQGEISVEDAQKIGYETAMRWTNGNVTCDFRSIYGCVYNNE
jgi:hypothetical protein